MRDFSSELTSFRTSSPVLTSSKFLLCVTRSRPRFYPFPLLYIPLYIRLLIPDNSSSNSLLSHLTPTRATFHFCSLVLEFVFTFLSPSRALLSISAHLFSNSLLPPPNPARAIFRPGSLVLEAASTASKPRVYDFSPQLTQSLNCFHFFSLSLFHLGSFVLQLAFTFFYLRACNFSLRLIVL